MKQQISPGVAGVIIAIVLIIAVFFLYRSTAGPGGPAPGEVGNPGPFSPGGAAQGKGANPRGGPGGSPMAPSGAPGSAMPGSSGN